VGDIKGSIHANDQKVSAALVVNGLLLTSVVTVVTRAGATYKKAHAWEHDLGIGMLIVALVTFLASVGWLLRAMKPYRPTELEKKIKDRYPRVFFPTELDLQIETPFTTWRARVEELQPATIFDEMTAEILKLADILHTESKRASKGYFWLVIEGGFVTAFFVLVAAVAI
jgi:hypothetical protein